MELDRVRQVDELPREVEPLRESLCERLDADSLGCVVSCGHEVDAELARDVEARLLRLAGEEEVVPLPCGVCQVLPCAAGHDRRPLHQVGPVGEDDRLAVEGVLYPPDELVDGRRLGQPPPVADPGEALRRLDPELTGQEGVVPDLRMCVESGWYAASVMSASSNVFRRRTAASSITLGALSQSRPW